MQDYGQFTLECLIHGLWNLIVLCFLDESMSKIMSLNWTFKNDHSKKSHNCTSNILLRAGRGRGDYEKFLPTSPFKNIQNLSFKIRLFCLFCLPLWILPHSSTLVMLLISLETPWWVRFPWGDFIISRTKVRKIRYFE